jgi:hypothetical protein
MSGTNTTPAVDGLTVQGAQIFAEMIQDQDGIVEYLQILLQKEKDFHPPCVDYLSKIRSVATSNTVTYLVNEEWRRKLCEWCYEVTDHFKCKYYGYFFIVFLHDKAHTNFLTAYQSRP